MDNNELKKIVAGYLRNGLELPKIQDLLTSEHGTTITFLDLRLLAAELDDVDWTKGEEENESGESEADASKDGETDSASGTVVEVDRIARPGVALSGSAKFASGASADWALDQFGRLALENQEGTPTQEDLMEFQEEIRRKLGGSQ